MEHTPIFNQEILEHLAPKPGGKYLDLTFGSGGHSQLILDACPGAQIVASDCDSQAINRAKELARSYPDNALVSNRAKFSEVAEVLRNSNHKLGIPTSLI